LQLIPPKAAAMRVLIVEDELLLAMDVDHIASMYGYTVAGSASNATDALELATAADIALVDINLSDGPSGLELGRRLVREHGITVIFLTANPEAVNRGVRGVAGVLTKPHTPASLVEALDYAAARRKGEDRPPPPGLIAFA
jgi:DNA-binding response OmpR family regulator